MALIKPALDHDLSPCMPHSLKRWCRQYDSLRENQKDDDDDSAFVFALTGKYTDATTKSEARAQLDLSDRVPRRQQPIHQVTDFDSVIGIITDNFPVQDDAVVQYHVINDVRYCLSSDLHIPGWLDRSTQGTTNEVRLQ